VMTFGFSPWWKLQTIQHSAFRMAMPEVPETIFMDGLNELFRRG
jgi:hypothetical protein